MFGLRLSSTFFALCLIATIRTVQGGQCAMVGREMSCSEIDGYPDSLDASIAVASASKSPRSREEMDTIEIIAPIGLTLTINENTFATFPNLTKLNIGLGYDCTLHIHPRAFRRTPALRVLRINEYNVSSDETVEAVTSLKDQLELFELDPNDFWTTTRRRNMDKIIPHLANFTRLRELRLKYGLSCDDFVPAVLLAKSASTLEELEINGCTPPDSKITIHTFSNMSNLVTLRWTNSNITEIESGSFDAIPKLQLVQFIGNPIRNLPDGLFAQSTKLHWVDFRYKGTGLTLVDNLSESNFTHVDNFEQFYLARGKLFGW